jgi:predicted small metal-binding protein
MKYQFACPLEGCEWKTTVDAQTEEEAANQLTQAAKEHLAQSHPEIHKTDEQIKSDITSMMTKVQDQMER